MLLEGRCRSLQGNVVSIWLESTWPTWLAVVKQFGLSAVRMFGIQLACFGRPRPNQVNVGLIIYTWSDFLVRDVVRSSRFKIARESHSSKTRPGYDVE